MVHKYLNVLQKYMKQLIVAKSCSYAHISMRSDVENQLTVYVILYFTIEQRENIVREIDCDDMLTNK